MMKAAARILTGLTVGLLAIATVPSVVAARSCRASAPAPASAATRTFMPTGLGIALTIPQNYRSMLRSSGHITFHDPNSFEYIQCLARTGEYGVVPPYVSLEVYQGVLPNLDLVQIVRRKRPWVDFYSPEFVPLQVAGRPAVQYEYRSEIDRISILNLSFLTDDGKTLLTLSGPADNPIMQNALAALAIAP